MKLHKLRRFERRDHGDKYTVHELANQTEWGCRRELALKMQELGFHAEFRLSFSVLFAGPFVMSHLPALTNREEFLWLCNKISNQYFRRWYGKRTDDRISYDHHGKPGPSYQDVQRYARGEARDQTITSTRTGTTYWLGYNEQKEEYAEQLREQARARGQGQRCRAREEVGCGEASSG